MDQDRIEFLNTVREGTGIVVLRTMHLGKGYAALVKYTPGKQPLFFNVPAFWAADVAKALARVADSFYGSEENGSGDDGGTP